MRKTMMFYFDGDDFVYVEQFTPWSPTFKKAMRVRREIIKELRDEGKTKEEIEEIVRCFGL